MQLKKKKPPVNIKAALTLAASALLGTIPKTVVAADNTTKSKKATKDASWDFESALLFYSESDRVSAAEAILNAKKTFDNDEILNLKLTVDVLTGASANGAAAQPNVQTFTRPSGKGSYQTQVNDTPLDDTFKDTRVQFNAQWTQPLADNYTGSVGVHISKEYDYLSLGINGNLAYDFNQKNSTFSVGLSYFQDTFEPEGGIPLAFASMPVAFGSSDDVNHSINKADFDATRRTDSDDKSTADIMFGFTQVINRRMIMQFNYSYSKVDGYLNDPFKVLSLVDSAGIAQDYVYENRPDSRLKQSLYAQTKYHFEKNIFDVSYRYMWDDWELDSHTIDSKLRVPLSRQSYIEPHFRFYKQSAAQFYQPFLVESHTLPEFASADYRIGEMSAYTLGIKYGTTLSGGNDLSFRLEYYRQDPTEAGHKAPGALSEVDLYESVNAIIAQVTYSF
ncbi:DUF3570 domain-containing protein [Colwellia sp. PAMC 21821]|uniref:DUF3570 domain-containing protein n=1 Tax=Colwellia sp. PAMC 21821 TaxID=1816219 RepID=UPI0009BCAA73|nr:DUF3570 domain-containing protein [Colwellia sp. PAMC 21821]ARD43070.1 hypothetical protein A3Q33_01235 [Colwellia sp. PAMC 21821]